MKRLRREVVPGRASADIVVLIVVAGITLWWSMLIVGMWVVS